MQRYRDYLTGQKFGKLTVDSFSHVNEHKQTVWKCSCECGGETFSTVSPLRFGTKSSCGCLRNPCAAANKKWKGHGEIGLSQWAKIEYEAKKRNLEFSITIEDTWNLFLKQDKRCALTGIVIGFGTSKRDVANRTASLDRIDSSKGYIPSNIQWVHKELNMMKQGLSQAKFIEYCKLVSNKT